jgi:hypothetical protein
MSERVLRVAVVLALAVPALRAQQSQPPSVNRAAIFAPEEATISGIHAALAAGNTTCVRVVQTHLQRIEAYDDRGPALNAIITINAAALESAAELDKSVAPRSAMRPLHCIPKLRKVHLRAR